MERLRRNVAANFVGIGLASGAPLLFNIVYYHLLGSEGYGLIGLYVTAQMIGVALDQGLSRPTAREVVRDVSRANGGTRVRSVVLTLLAVDAALFLALAVVVGALSRWISTSWLNAGGLDQDTVTLAVALMGLSIALQQPRTVLIAALNGLHRQVLTNSMVGAAAVLRGVVTVTALVVSPGIEVFFWTQAIMAALETLSIGLIAWGNLPAAAEGTRARLDWSVLRSVRGFALSDGASVAIGTLIVNADKLVLSGLVSLPVLGSYSLLSLVAQALARLPAPFTIAHFPRFVELRESGDAAALARVYRRANVGLTTLLVPAATAAVIFAAPISEVLLGSQAGMERPDLVFALLAIAFTANALLHLPYALQLASGWTRLGLILNVVVLVSYVPLLSMFAPFGGPMAAAALFFLAMTIPFPVAVHLTHRRLLPQENRGWWRIVVATPIGVSCLAVIPARLLSISLAPWAAAIVAVVAALAALAALVALRSARERSPREGSGAIQGDGWKAGRN